MHGCVRKAGFHTADVKGARSQRNRSGGSQVSLRLWHKDTILQLDVISRDWNSDEIIRAILWHS